MTMIKRGESANARATNPTLNADGAARSMMSPQPIYTSLKLNAQVILQSHR